MLTKVKEITWSDTEIKHIAEQTTKGLIIVPCLRQGRLGVDIDSHLSALRINTGTGTYYTLCLYALLRIIISINQHWMHLFVEKDNPSHSTPEYIRDRNCSVNSTHEYIQAKTW